MKYPIFTLDCIKSDYPCHFCVGVKYRVDLNTLNKDKECDIYWYHPMENKWVLIGAAPLSYFNVLPVKKWIENNKESVNKPKERIQPLRERV